VATSNSSDETPSIAFVYLTDDSVTAFLREQTLLRVVVESARTSNILLYDQEKGEGNDTAHDVDSQL
jgi:hypothetical protein